MRYGGLLTGSWKLTQRCHIYKKKNLCKSKCKRRNKEYSKEANVGEKLCLKKRWHMGQVWKDEKKSSG